MHLTFVAFQLALFVFIGESEWNASMFLIGTSVFDARTRYARNRRYRDTNTPTYFLKFHLPWVDDAKRSLMRRDLRGFDIKSRKMTERRWD